MPVYDNRNEIGKHMNRRVELKLLGDQSQYAAQKNNQNTEGKISSLINNVPNPFSGCTVVNAFLLPEVKEARVIITDISGKQIKTVYLLERGDASFNFEAWNLPAGIYMATLLADGQSAGSIKMIQQ